MMIDMHAHWRPAEVADALRARTREPRIVAQRDGVEVLKAPRMGEEPLAEAFDDVDVHLARMDRQGVEISVLSVLGSFCWIESQPLDVSVPLCRRVNDRFSAICAEHPGRFAAFAALPLTDLAAAAAELERVMALPGMIGAQLPGNFFLTRDDAEAARPLLEVANRHHAVLFIHHGPRPGDAFPKVGGDTDNARRRNGTLDMQASLSSVMVTLCLTDLLAPIPRRDGRGAQSGRQHSLRGRADGSPLPARHAGGGAAVVALPPGEGCTSIATRSGRARSRRRCALYGAERIVCGTDGTAFGVDWTRKALAEAEIGEEAREAILHRNAAALIARAGERAVGAKAAA